MMQFYQWGRPAQKLDLSKFKRLVIWFSCGAASAIAADIALNYARASGIETVVAYIDPGSEHEDRVRFLCEIETMLDHKVTILKSEKYADTWAVWEGERYISGINGAPCTQHLKKQVREQFEREGDLQVFGYDSDEIHRVERFAKHQPEVALWCPLADTGTPKQLCYHILDDARIALPAMYLLGYSNANCIGCPKGGAGYWNKIRRDFPEVFARMAILSRELGARLVQVTIDGVRQRVFLDELNPTAGRYIDEPAMSCGLFCNQPAEAA